MVRRKYWGGGGGGEGDGGGDGGGKGEGGGAGEGGIEGGGKLGGGDGGRLSTATVTVCGGACVQVPKRSPIAETSPVTCSRTSTTGLY